MVFHIGGCPRAPKIITKNPLKIQTDFLEILEPKIHPKCSRNGARMCPKMYEKSSKKASKKRCENELKMDAKTEPGGDPGTLKIKPRGTPGRSRAPRGYPGCPRELPGHEKVTKIEPK